MKTQSRPCPGSLVSVTSKGEVCLFDPMAMEKSGLDTSSLQNDSSFIQSINVAARPLPIVHLLENGFGLDSSLFVQGDIHKLCGMQESGGIMFE